MNKCSKHLVAGALALVLGLLVGALNCHATEFYWTNTTSGSTWSDCNHTWFTNGVPVINGNCYPGQGFGSGIDDAAIFTNGDSTGNYAYTVSIDNASDPATVGSNWFQTASNESVTITYELNGVNHFNVQIGGANPAWIMGDHVDSTTTVYMSSWGTGPNDGFLCLGQPVIGRRGCATLILTNGIMNTGTTSFGTGSQSAGHLLVYSPTAHITGNAGPFSVIYTNLGQFNIGSTNSIGNSIMVSNGAFVYVQSTFKVGSSEDGGSCSNTVIVAEGGALSLGGNSRGVVGKRITGSANNIGAYDNYLLIKSNAWFNGKNHSFYIGFSTDDVSQGPATNNGVRVLYGGALTNISQDIIQSNNWLDLQGGVYGSHLTQELVGAEGGGITNFGLITAWGKIQSTRLTVAGDIVTNLVAGGLDTNYATLYVRSSQGPLVVRNALSFTNQAILQVELGATNFLPIKVQPGTNTESTVEILDGSILNIINSGGFTAPAPGKSQTYAIITNTCGICATNIYLASMSIGTVPTSSCVGCTYTLSTNSVDTVLQLTVTAPEFRITSIARSGNNVVVTWLAPAGTADRVQAALGTNYATAVGNYAGTWADIIATNLNVAGTSGYTTMTYTDPYFATNNAAVSRFYRIRQVP